MAAELRLKSRKSVEHIQAEPERPENRMEEYAPPQPEEEGDLSETHSPALGYGPTAPEMDSAAGLRNFAGFRWRI